MADLTTAASVKAFIGKTDGNDDALLSALVTAYSDWVCKYCNRDFVVTPYSIWRDGRNNVALPLPQYPVQSVQALSVNGRDIGPSASFDGYGYRFTDTEIVLGGGARFAFGRKNINVRFTAGYDTVPPAIAEAVTELVAVRYKLRDKMEWTSSTLNGETRTLTARDMPAAVATVLNQARNVVPL